VDLFCFFKYVTIAVLFWRIHDFGCFILFLVTQFYWGATRDTSLDGFPAETGRRGALVARIFFDGTGETVCFGFVPRCDAIRLRARVGRQSRTGPASGWVTASPVAVVVVVGGG
jgi:hypothetical protein